MNTTIKALQNVFVALGGEAEAVADINLIPDMLDAIAERITERESEANEEEIDDGE